jgi:protein TonB
LFVFWYVKDNTPLIELAQLPPEKPPILKPALPEKPLPSAPPPVREASIASTVDGLDVQPVDVSIPSVNIDNTVSSVTQTPEQDATPVVRMEPKYPIDAARNGIQGWVELSFSIDSTGQVQDVKVTNSEPRRVFDQAAMQALKRWKYRPKVVDGKAIVQPNLAVRLDFNLEQQ